MAVEARRQAAGMPEVQIWILGPATAGGSAFVYEAQVTGPWTERLKLLMKACGWTIARLAEEMGIGSGSLTRVMRGGRAKVQFVLRLQALESLHADNLTRWKETRGRWRPRKADLFPPAWVECRERWWTDEEQASRPEDLAEMGTGSADPSGVLTGRYGSDNFPGRTLKVVDWTTAGRALYRKNRPSRARRRKIVDLRTGGQGSVNQAGVGA